MKKYVIVSNDGIIKECYERTNEIEVFVPENHTEFEYVGTGIASTNHKAILNGDKTFVVDFGEYVEPEQIVPKPTTEEILLQALLEIQELKSKVAELEGAK